MRAEGRRTFGLRRDGQELDVAAREPLPALEQLFAVGRGRGYRGDVLVFRILGATADTVERGPWRRLE